MKFRALLLVFGAYLSSAYFAQAQTIFIWNGSNDQWDTGYGANWAGGVALTGSDVVSTQVVFKPSAVNTHLRYAAIWANKLDFTGITKAYWLQGDYDTTHIGSGGIVYAPVSPVTTYIDGNIKLEANQTWDIQSGTLVNTGVIQDSPGVYTLTKTGAGTLSLMSPNSPWSGGLILSAGNVEITSDGYGQAGLGTGALTFNGGTLVATPYYFYSANTGKILNDIFSNGSIKTINKTDLHFGFDGETGFVTLNANTTVDTSGRPLFIEGDISETTPGTKLTLNGPGVLVLSGTNTYTGGTDVTNGALIFATLQSLPAAPSLNTLTSSVNGYVGMGDDGTLMAYDFQTAFVDRFNKAATFGTIGFDTDPSLSPTVFTSAINLTGFAASVKLGSATHAIINAPSITPQGTDYRFGGGGGFLEVDTQLTGARNLVVDSPAASPLTLYLTAYNNDYTGTTSVTRSALIFADTAMPIASGLITIGAGGYVGTESANSGSQPPDDSDIATFLAHIAPASVGMIGFDDTFYSARTLSRDINLSTFTGALYLGTATPGYTNDGIGQGLVLDGLITTTNGGNDPYRFAGYKGGLLEIASNLTGSHGIIIGDPNSPATFGDYANQTYSTVYLSGDNSAMSGNVTFYAGQLFVGQDTSLGTGTLIVQPMTFPAAWTASGDDLSPVLGYYGGGSTIANNVVLNTRLDISTDSDFFSLTGLISGVGSLYLQQYAGIALANNANSFTGGIYLGGGSELDLDGDTAAGPGPLSFGGQYAYVYLDTTAPIIHGLISNNTVDYSYIYAEYANTVLTINQSFNSQFQGEFQSDDLSDSLRIVKTGTGNLTFDNTSIAVSHGTVEATLSGTPEVNLQVNQGTVTFSANSGIQASAATVWVHGGTLALDNNYGILNPVVVDNSGRLQGSGAIANSVTLFSSAVVSPGLGGSANIGALTFNDLTIKGGATFELTIMDPNGSAGFGWDLISISTGALHIDSSVTAGTPFTIKLVTLDANGAPGTGVGFLDQFYTWTIINGGTNPIVFGGGSLDPTAIHFDTSAFNTNLGSGTFYIGQSGNLLQVTFVPVPEPSTYALLGLGLSAMAAAYRRRRA